MLSLYRRHLAKCPHRSKGQHFTKCSCPIWCDGEVNGNRLRQSLKLRDWQRATRKLAALEDPNARQSKSIRESIEKFQQHIRSLEHSTQRKYGNVLRQLQAYCETRGLEDLSEIKVEHLDDYRATRNLARITEQKELELLRQFFAFCCERDWIEENPAKRIKSAKNIKPNEVIPYSSVEIARIVGACEAIGRASYERLRAKTMILLLYHTALRISDVATLSRDRVHDGQIHVRTLKTGGKVFLPVPPDLQLALDSLPAPRGSGSEWRFFFWNGVTSRRAVIGIAERTLAAVFRGSGVKDAHAHRFRHTLATRLLGVGASLQEVADVLGISPNIVREHYGKWSPERQQRISGLMRAAQLGTNLVHEKNQLLTN
jgi:integrase/recombinase XerC